MPLTQKKRSTSERPTVLVTGGAGFIGSHLCDELIKRHRIICVDNFRTGNVENISHLLKNPDFEFIRHDLIEPLDLDTLPELERFKIPYEGIAAIYHLACPTSPKDYHAYPIETLLANSHATRNALEWAVKYNARFLHASSSAVYGEPLQSATPFPETYWGYIDPIGPRSPYSEGKRFAESLVVHYQNVKKVPVRIARLFNTFGPRMKLTDGRMIPDLIAAALENRDLEVHGDPDASATFCYVNDIVEGIMKLVDADLTGPVNLGNPKAYRIHEVVEKIIAFTGSTSRLVAAGPLPSIAKQPLPDISKAKHTLGWFPVVSLDDGLRRTIEDMKGSRVLRLADLTT